MGLRFTLQDDDRVILDLPLSRSEWREGTRELVVRELGDSEADIDALCEISDFFSNKRRLQMLNHLVKDCNNSASFTDLLRVGGNPKYVYDLVNRTTGRDLVVKDGKGYSLSPLGLGSFLLLSLATQRLVRATDGVNGDDKSFEAQ
jgi:hypothetical protein